MNKKTIVHDFLKGIETGDRSGLAHVKRYTQHNLAIEDGLEGLAKVLAALPSAKVDTVRLLEDGDFVVAHTAYDFFGAKIGFDVFRFEGDQIVEHWDNLAPRASAPNASGRTQIDGPTAIEDREHTAANKELVARFVTTVLIEQQLANAAALVDGYLQHNPMVGDGLAALGGLLQQLAAHGSTIVYRKLHRVLGEGNFVLAISEGTLGREPTAFYDLFRVAGGKIVEHWDVIESIPPRSAWANSNGKF
jgi:predicted SnoaL-like aldol condensation-catalyzing enzyme